jgi:hypothetical protein
MFFGSPDLGLNAASRSKFTLAPTEGMLEDQSQLMQYGQ